MPPRNPALPSPAGGTATGPGAAAGYAHDPAGPYPGPSAGPERRGEQQRPTVPRDTRPPVPPTPWGQQGTQQPEWPSGGQPPFGTSQAPRPSGASQGRAGPQQPSGRPQPEWSSGGPQQPWPPGGQAPQPEPGTYPPRGHVPPVYGPQGQPPAGASPRAPLPEAVSVPARPRRRTGLLVALVIVLALALAIAGLVVVRPGPLAGWLGGAARPGASPEQSESPPPPVLAQRVDPPIPTADGVRAAIDKLVTGSGLGPRVNVSVLDVSTGQSLYDHGAEALTVPASTTKLVTALAVLAARGPAHRIPTRAVAGDEPGEVVLVGGGDPTLAVGATGYYPGAGRLDQLAAQVKRALGGTPPAKVTVDSSLFSGPVYGPGWDADIPTGGYGGAITALMTDGARVNPKAKLGYAERVRNPDLVAGRAFAKLLGLPDGAVAKGTAPAATSMAAAPSAGAATSTGAAGPGAELGRVESPPIIRLVDVMLGESDNIVAEALARQVALARNQPASFAGGAAAVDAVLGELGLSADQSDLADGSGLSRSNRVTPSLLAHALALSANGARPELTSLTNGLPVGGWSGTLAGRFGGKAGTAAGAGVVRAKTGTLDGVHAISGFVVTAEGRLLAFAILADRVPFGSDQAQPRLDKIAAALAGCGCR